jgi:hypothetical protein
MKQNKTLIDEEDQLKQTDREGMYSGQTHFPVTYPALGVSTILALIILAIGATLLVWWLKS